MFTEHHAREGGVLHHNRVNKVSADTAQALLATLIPAHATPKVFLLGTEHITTYRGEEMNVSEMVHNEQRV